MTPDRRPNEAAPLLEGDETFAGIDRTDVAVITGIWHLVLIGLVAATTVILFSLASEPLLGIGKAPIIGVYIAMEESDEADGQIPAVPAPTYSPMSEAEKVLPAFPSQHARGSEVSEAGRAKPDFEPASPDPDASTTPVAAGVPILTQDIRITNAQSIEQLGSIETAAAEGRPIADGIGTAPDVSRQTVPSEIPDEGRREVSHSIEIPQDEPANLYHDNLPPEQKAPAQDRHDQPLHHRPLSSNTALNSRVQKECGSIIFPALRRHCVASFGIHDR
jgi:hypothetical protein